MWKNITRIQTLLNTRACEQKNPRPYPSGLLLKTPPGTSST